jgi:uncharacterized protein
LKKYIIISLLVTAIILFFFIKDSSFPENHGVVEIQLFLGDSENQPLIVGFGGSEGGNVMATEALKSTRDQFLQRGYAFLAVGYFGTENTPKELDRISLNAIYDSIISASNHPKINRNKIILYGGSRGGELILNLASRYEDIDGVIALAPANVSLPSKFGWRETSSWTFQNEEVPYVTGSREAIKLIHEGDFYNGFREMLKDEESVQAAEIRVDKINCPILILSAKDDEVWPSTLMANRMVERLRANKFAHPNKHIAFEGGHAELTKHADVIFEFLKEYL